MVAAVGRDQLAALGLIWILPVVKSLFQGLRDSFALADFMLLVVDCGRRQSSFCDRKFSNLFRTKQYDKIL